MTPAPAHGRVGVARCHGYSTESVARAVDEALARVGGMSAFVSPGQRVLLKPNLLMKAEPDRAVTTHPELVRAAIRQVKACGATDIAVGDSPGGRSTKASARAVFEASGLADVCSEEGVRTVLLDDEAVRVPSPEGRLYRSFNIGREVAEADVLINLPKLKTHGFMQLTGAVKNHFGCVPGFEKAQFHVKVPDRDDFGDMLVDLMLACRPALHIMDAVVAMEGEGPSGGSPREIGAVLASPDGFALDAVAASIAGFDPMEVYTSAAAARRGIGPRSVDECDVAGTPWRELAVDDFDKPARDVNGRMPAPFRKWVRRRVASRPFLERPRDCTGCATCQRSCPVSAISMVDRRPAFDLDTCIRCYCCQELCPERAIGLSQPGLARVLFGRNKA